MKPAADGAAANATVRARLVALGASNLARGMLSLLDAQRDACGGPIEALAALGHGRSYGIESSLLGRRIGGIDDCGLWQALANRPPAPTTALLMDVGNDLLYGIAVPQILEWVERALQRLQHAERRIVIGLPLATVRTLGHRRFVFVRSILWPACRLSLPEAVRLSEQTHSGLHALSQRYGATFHELPAAWYGFDPVHIRRRHWPHAARTLLEVPAGTPRLQNPTDGPLARLRLLGTAPAERTLFGRPQRREQPARRWQCGSTLAMW